MKNDKRHKRIRHFLQKFAVIYAGNDFLRTKKLSQIFTFSRISLKIAEKHKDKLGPNFDLASYETMIRQSLKAGFHLIVCSDAPTTDELYYESF